MCIRDRVKSDQEESIIALREAMAAHKGVEVQVEESPVGDSASNGYVESAIRQVQKQIRTFKCYLEYRLKTKLSWDHPILPWLVRHAGATINRYNIGKDGQTAHQRVRGRPFSAHVTDLGECVWFKLVKGNTRGKLDSKWGKGVWLGIREESNESFIGTPAGVIKVRTFRRRGSDEERWNLEEVNAFRGVPWEPIPGREGVKIRSRVYVPVLSLIHI